MIHFHRWSIWSLPVRVGHTFAEQYRCCTKCGKSDSRTIDCAGNLKEVHDALRSVDKSPSDKDHAVDLPTTREITRSILRSQIWQKLYGNVDPELTATEINLRHEIRDLKQKLESVASSRDSHLQAFLRKDDEVAALSRVKHNLETKLKTCEQQRDAAYEERNRLVEKLDASVKRRGELEAEVASLRMASKCLWCGGPMRKVRDSEFIDFTRNRCGGIFTVKNK